MAAASAEDTETEGDVSLLVRVLAGNSVTSTIILSCLNTADARHLRRLHPAVAGTVADLPWHDMDTPVVDLVRWRAGMSAAVGARVSQRPTQSRHESESGRQNLNSGHDAVGSVLPAFTTVWHDVTTTSGRTFRRCSKMPLGLAPPALAALAGVTHLDLRECGYVTDELLLHLPASLHKLSVCWCSRLTERATFAHLTALRSLDCRSTSVVSTRTEGLPVSLQELDISWTRALNTSVSLAHLMQLRVLRADWSTLDNIMLASLPPCLKELHAAQCDKLTPAASFAHLPTLCTLDVAQTAINNISLASMPPSLVSLIARRCENLTHAAVLPHLPVLQLLDLRDTDIGNPLVASLPASLVELWLAGCHGVTAGAMLDHLRSLRVLHCIGTKLTPASLAACRDRGCVVPAARQLRGHSDTVRSFAMLGDDRLASIAYDGVVRLWDVAAGGEATTVPRAGGGVLALVALPDGRRMAIGTASWVGDGGCIEMWDVGGVAPARCATIDCGSSVWALAVLADGRLAAGCDVSASAVQIVDVDAGAVVAMLRGHVSTVRALALLPDGTLASASEDKTVRVWDVGARACVATLTGHTSHVLSLAVLADGRLASKSIGDEVWLWDVSARTRVGVLTAQTAMAALPDGRLATVSKNGPILLWDMRPAAAAGASRAAGAAPAEVVGVLCLGSAVFALPDGRLACHGGGLRWGAVHLLDLPPPAPYE